MERIRGRLWAGGASDLDVNQRCTEDVQCKSGLICDPVPGKCPAGMREGRQTSGREGEGCSNGGKLCGEGLFCRRIETGVGSFQCTRRLVLGASCGASNDSQGCGEALYCDPASATSGEDYETFCHAQTVLNVTMKPCVTRRSEIFATRTRCSRMAVILARPSPDHSFPPKPDLETSPGLPRWPQGLICLFGATVSLRAF